MTAAPTDPEDYLPLDHIRLIASDLDDTLIGHSGQIPDGLWPLLQGLAENGVMFAPATGRQLSTLKTLFHPALKNMPLVSANGALVEFNGQILAKTVLTPEELRTVVTGVRTLADNRVNVGVALLGTHSSYLERTDAPFTETVTRYFHEMETTDDLLAVPEDIVKAAIYSFDGLEPVREYFNPFKDDFAFISSAENWQDITAKDIDKGHGVRAVQEHFGISPHETLVFGDYLNDLGLVDVAEYSFAVANAHPHLLERARYVAPTCEDQGVLQVISQIN